MYTLSMILHTLGVLDSVLSARIKRNRDNACELAFPTSTPSSSVTAHFFQIFYHRRLLRTRIAIVSLCMHRVADMKVWISGMRLGADNSCLSMNVSSLIVFYFRQVAIDCDTLLQQLSEQWRIYIIYSSKLHRICFLTLHEMYKQVEVLCQTNLPFTISKIGLFQSDLHPVDRAQRCVQGSTRATMRAEKEG